MSSFQVQLKREAGWDIRVSAVGLTLFFVLCAILPRSWFWFWFLPMAAFWFRYLWVRNARDEDLLRADLAGNGRRSAAGCYRSEAGICISDGTHQILISRQKPQALVHLIDVVRDK